jgi:nitroreductase
VPDFYDVARSQRGVRYYKPDPVSDEAVERILAAATRAPSGNNKQPWRFVVVRDAGVKAELGRLYLLGQARTRGQSAPSTPPAEGPVHFSFGMEQVPVVIMVYAAHNTDGASIYPAVQNLMLAAAAEGLGTRLTTTWRSAESEVARLLGVPDEWNGVALIPLGYPAEPDHLGGSRRKPVSEVAYLDHWGVAL